MEKIFWRSPSGGIGRSQLICCWKKKISADDYRIFLTNYKNVRNSVAKDDPKLDVKDVDDEITELEQIQSKSPDKLTKIMQAFSEEDDDHNFIQL